MHVFGRLLFLAFAGVCVTAAAPPPRVTAERIEALIEQLGDEEPDRREEASRALDGIGEPALPALRRAATGGGDLETAGARGDSLKPSPAASPPATWRASRGPGMASSRNRAGCRRRSKPGW
jgi:hypothetical protein